VESSFRRRDLALPIGIATRLVSTDVIDDAIRLDQSSPSGLVIEDPNDRVAWEIVHETP